MKIDVEGHELSVLDGMNEFLRSSSKPQHLIIEVSRANLKHRQVVFDVLTGLGYLHCDLGNYPHLHEIGPFDGMEDMYFRSKGAGTGF